MRMIALLILVAVAPVTGQGTAGIAGHRALALDGTVHVLGRGDVSRDFVLVFMGTECPISNKYVPRLKRLAVSAREQGFGFYGVLSDPGLTRAAALKHRAEFAIDFTQIVDVAGELAARLKPSHVPMAFVITKRDEVAYRGRIDDWYAALGKPRRQPKTHDLVNAMTSLAKGEEVATPVTEPVGCLFEAWGGNGAVEKPTWVDHVAPLLAANCVECHREGEVGPMSFATFGEAKRRAKMIAKVTHDGVMPPWRATAGKGTFLNERRLGSREVALLRRWASAGAPKGEGEEPVVKLSPPGFRHGEPDLVIEMPEAYELPAEGDDVYRYFVIPSGLTERRHIVGYQFIPGNAEVVHHALVWADTSGKSRARDEKDPGPGFKGSFDVFGPGFANSGPIGGWTPGMNPHRMPEGWGIPIVPGTDIVLEIHYHLNGKKTSDRSRLGLYFAKEEVKTVAGLWVGTFDIAIEPGEKEYSRHAWMKVPRDVTLVDAMPHMHYLGKTIHADATTPDGEVIPLIHIDDWDFRWQDFYRFAEPIHLKKGTVIDIRMTWDNSADNPANPSREPVNIGWGWQTTDEMGEVTFTALPAKPRDAGPLMFAAFSSFMRKGDGSKKAMDLRKLPKMSGLR